MSTYSTTPKHVLDLSAKLTKLFRVEDIYEAIDDAFKEFAKSYEGQCFLLQDIGRLINDMYYIGTNCPICHSDLHFNHYHWGDCIYEALRAKLEEGGFLWTDKKKSSQDSSEESQRSKSESDSSTT